MFNRVLGLGLERPATPGDVEEIAAFFRELGVEWCAAVAPRAEPADLQFLLGAAGLQPGYAWAKFRRGVDGEAPARTRELQVEGVDERQGRTFAETFGRGYGVPEPMHDWLALLPGREGGHCFLARDGDAPAAGAVFVGSRVGWLGIAATLPEYRRRGAQSALLAARIRAAGGSGCELVVTETGALVDGKPSNSYRNILRAGFELDYVRANYLSSPAADTSGTE
jgi:GNAT superfamily N-acetyltransferase